jgi:hypothetical protein
MADFARWGSAIAEAIGWNKEEFIQAYNRKNEEQNEEALMQSPVASILISFMQDKTEWTGTADTLLTLLISHGSSGSFSDNSKKLPKAPNALTAILNELKPNLKQIGILFDTGKENGSRKVTIQKVGDAKININTEFGNFETDSLDDVDDKDENFDPF